MIEINDIAASVAAGFLNWGVKEFDPIRDSTYFQQFMKNHS